MTASSRRISSRSIWNRKSGVVSTTMVVVGDWTRMLERSLLSLASVEAHTSQGHATMGTPVLVPVPRKVIFNGGFFTGVNLLNQRRKALTKSTGKSIRKKQA